jgi:hypothetical protein
VDFHLGLRAAHESDHETAHAHSSPGFLALNFLEIPAGVDLALRRYHLGLQAAARLYLLSCITRRRQLAQVGAGVAWTLTLGHAEPAPSLKAAM